ncbi:phage tail tube protein [Xanthobacteraceae bacterium A53D]
MAKPVTIKGGMVRILIETATAGTYAAPCGFTSRSITLTKALEEVNIPDCDDPDAVDWLGRDATSLSMAVTGEGLLAQNSVEVWLDAWESIESVGVKVEWEFPAKTITWTGSMHVESFEVAANNGQRVTATVSLQSDGEMVRVVDETP